jgi:hypothetical protein
LSGCRFDFVENVHWIDPEENGKSMCEIEEELRIKQFCGLSVRISGIKPGVNVLLGVREDILWGV